MQNKLIVICKLDILITLSILSKYAHYVNNLKMFGKTLQEYSKFQNTPEPGSSSGLFVGLIFCGWYLISFFLPAVECKCHWVCCCYCCFCRVMCCFCWCSNCCGSVNVIIIIIIPGRLEHHGEVNEPACQASNIPAHTKSFQLHEQPGHLTSDAEEGLTIFGHYI